MACVVQLTNTPQYSTVQYSTVQGRPPGCLCYLFPVSLPGVDVAQHGVSQHVVTGHPQQVALLTLHQVVVRATHMAHMAELSVLFLSRVEMIH